MDHRHTIDTHVSSVIRTPSSVGKTTTLVVVFCCNTTNIT
jgi:hypothetical protein